MKVLAVKGQKCPMEGKPREYITDSEPVDVPDDSTFYRRLIADGSLIRAEARKPVSPEANKSNTANKAYEEKGGKK
jgi:hypothetical protein